MDNRDRKYLEKIYNRIEKVLLYCQGCKGLEEFESNPMRVEATVFNFMQIGEIANSKLSDEAKKAMPDIPWHMVYGMRNRIVHGYEGVDMSIVWETIKQDFPELKRKIDKYITMT